VDEHDPEASVADTFEQVAKEFYAQKRKTWSKDYDDRWIGGMEHRVFDAIGDKPIAEVTSRDILEIMQLAVEEGSPTSAQAVKRRTGQVFRYAIASQRIEIDPSAALAGYVHHKTKHRKGLKPTKLRKLLNDLDSSPPCHPRTALTMRLIILTFVRTKEIINSRWEDVDFNKGLWCIGADEMKKDRDFLVPLSRQSVELLHQIKEMTRNDEFIVPSFFNPHKGMSRNTINNVLRKMKYDISGHGFRTTASTILHEQGFLTEIIEKQLAHEDGDTSRKPYNHAEYLEARVEMMQSWADYIDELRSS
jgi:integrase